MYRCKLFKHNDFIIFQTTFIMKKLFLFAAMAATVLASCAKNEVFQKKTNQTPVNFGIYTGRMSTKAVSATTYGQINTVDLLKASSYGFGVFGYYTEGANYSSTCKPNFMYNQKVYWNASKWTYIPIKYWPNEFNETTATGHQTDKLTFFAYAPYVEVLDADATPVTISDGAAGTPAAADEGIVSISKNNAEGDPTVTFKVPAASNKQIDLLWADNSESTIIDLVKPVTGTATTFHFKHALSKLSLYPVVVVDTNPDIPASSGTDVATGTTVTINSITISGKFNQEGTLNLHTGAWTSSAAASAQQVSYNPASPLDVTAINDKAEADLGSPCAEFMFIPSSSAQDYVITIDYDYTTTDAALSGGSVTIHNTIHNTLSSVNFLVGKKMKLYIGLGLNSVVFKAAVADWADDTSKEIWLPINIAS